VQVLKEAWNLLSDDVKAILRITESNLDALNTVDLGPKRHFSVGECALWARLTGPKFAAQVAAVVSLVEAPANHCKATTVAKEVMAIMFGNRTSHSIKKFLESPFAGKHPKLISKGTKAAAAEAAVTAAEATAAANLEETKRLAAQFEALGGGALTIALPQEAAPGDPLRECWLAHERLRVSEARSMNRAEISTARTDAAAEEAEAAAAEAAAAEAATTKGGDDENNEEEEDEDEDGDDASGATAMSGSGEDESGSSESESDTGDGEEEGAKCNSGKFDLMVSQELQHTNSHLVPCRGPWREVERRAYVRYSLARSLPLCAPPPPRRPRPTT
jgi:hypothetical protein